MAIRSFLAFEVPLDMKKDITGVLEDIRRSKLNVRWVKVDNIHLTVVFIGNIREEDLPEIRAAGDAVSSKYGPFYILLKGLGIFPNARRPRVMWIGLDGDIERISNLRDDLQISLETFGLKKEKRTFKPHLTIGRFRKPGRGDPPSEDILARYTEFRGAGSELDELILFKSELRPGGAVYTKLGSWKLSGKE